MSRAKIYMFAATLLMFIGAAIIWLIGIIGIIQGIQDVLILTNEQPLENKFSKINHEITILDIIGFVCQAVIVCESFYSDIKRILK